MLISHNKYVSKYVDIIGNHKYFYAVMPKNFCVISKAEAELAWSKHGLLGASFVRAETESDLDLKINEALGELIIND